MSDRRIVLVSGPPAAGKTMWVNKQRQENDIVIEWERIAEAITGSANRSQSSEVLSVVGAMRRAAIEALSKPEVEATAWVIVGAPKAEERAELAKALEAETFVVLCSKNEGLRRIENDETRTGVQVEQSEALERWWSDYSEREEDTVVWTDREEASVAESVAQSTPKSMSLYKTYNATIDVKAASDAAPHGEFTALVSVFGNVDLVGDRVVKGAFADSLAEYEAAGKSIPVVWSHDWNTPESYIGKAISAEETDEGLLVKGAFFDTERAQTVRNLLTERVVSEFSFAYDVIDEQKADDGANELLKLKLLEVGPTLKGANPETQLVAAKAGPEDAKAGRVLSSKNESAIREAKQLLDSVLSSLAEPAKSAEPITLEAEETVLETDDEIVGTGGEGLDPAVAIALLDLADH